MTNGLTIGHGPHDFLLLGKSWPFIFHQRKIKGEKERKRNNLVFTERLFLFSISFVEKGKGPKRRSTRSE
jgi:hypothetical protein